MLGDPLAPGRSWSLVPTGRAEVTRLAAGRYRALACFRGVLSPEEAEHEVRVEFVLTKQGEAWKVGEARIVSVDGNPGS